MTNSTQNEQVERDGGHTAADGRTASNVLLALKHFFWMDNQMAAATRDGYGPDKLGWDEFLLARAAANDAKTLGESGEGLGSALLLFRTTIMLLTRIHLARLGIEVSPTATGDECWAKFAEQPGSAALVSELSTNQRGLIVSILGIQGETFLAKQLEKQRKIALDTMTDVAKSLSTHFEADASRIQSVLLKRWSKISGLALVVLLGLCGLWQMYSNRPRANLALHQKVTISSTHPVWGKDPSQLVDGNRTELGMHSQETANQNATIDLGDTHRVSKVVVYNRSDCCQQRAAPLKIEVSVDGNQYTKVAERTEPFEREWTANFFPKKARYVRLTNLSATFLHLNEIEVY